MVAFVDQGNGYVLASVDLAAGTTTVLDPDATGRLLQLSPDGLHVVYQKVGATGEVLAEVPIHGGSPGTIGPSAVAAGVRATFTPDGKRVIAEVGSGSTGTWRLVSMALDTATSTTLAPDLSSPVTPVLVGPTAPGSSSWARATRRRRRPWRRSPLLAGRPSP